MRGLRWYRQARTAPNPVRDPITAHPSPQKTGWSERKVVPGVAGGVGDSMGDAEDIVFETVLASLVLMGSVQHINATGCVTTACYVRQRA